MNKPSYRMFVDESGDDCMKQFSDLNSEHLCLNGVILSLSDTTVESDINTIKQSFFNIDTQKSNYPLHRKELIKRTPPFEILADDSRRKEFNNELLRLIGKWDFTTVTVLIDKKKLKMKYAKPYNPYYFGFALLMERYIIFLKNKKATGDIMIESINKTYDKKLKNVYKHLYNYDMPIFKFDHEEFQTYLSSSELKLKKKRACICGLEVTDLTVNALKKEIYQRYYPERSCNNSFDAEIVGVISEKILKKGFRQNGIGLKVFP